MRKVFGAVVLAAVVVSAMGAALAARGPRQEATVDVLKQLKFKAITPEDTTAPIKVEFTEEGIAQLTKAAEEKKAMYIDSFGMIEIK